jgi:UDP-N-acetylmuramate dehydrogenase
MNQAALTSSHIFDLTNIRGRLTEDAPLGMTGWFKAGGNAQYLFKPEDLDDLIAFLKIIPSDMPITVLGAMSNTIVRDGGIRGVVIRLGRTFSDIKVIDDYVEAGALALDANVAKVAAEAGRAGLEFYSGIPGTIGGALRMNAGCYGTETKDVLINATAVDRNGNIHVLTPEQMGMSYRHTETPADYIFVSACFKTRDGNREEILEHLAGIKERRSTSQPIKEKTGGSTFANPAAEDVAKAGFEDGTKVWQLIDKAGCRGLRVGGAQMSELHCNFMINADNATGSDLENLGEEVRRRVFDMCGITLRWEVKRMGEHA